MIKDRSLKTKKSESIQIPANRIITSQSISLQSVEFGNFLMKQMN